MVYKTNINATYLKSHTILLGITIISLLSGCSNHRQTGGEIRKAEAICDDMNEQFINDQTTFNRLKIRMKDPLVRNYCGWRVGLKLPQGKKYWVTLIDKDKTDYKKENTAEQSTK